MKKIITIILCCLFIIRCYSNSESDQSFDIAYNTTTSYGQKIQDNGYYYDSDILDNKFVETEACLGYSEIPADIYIILTEPYKTFKCDVRPDGACRGLYEYKDNKYIITISADLVYLRHEYIHYMLWYVTGDLDREHKSEYFLKCS